MARGDKERFFREWFDYVNELIGPLSRTAAWSLFVDERRHLLVNLERGPLQVWRHVRLPEGTDITTLPGGEHDLGQFWTLSKDVARNWDGNTTYDEDRPALREGTVRVLLGSEVRLEDIDMIATIACRLGATWEDEIRLLPRRPVQVLSAESLDAPAPVPAL